MFLAFDMKRLPTLTAMLSRTPIVYLQAGSWPVTLLLAKSTQVESALWLLFRTSVVVTASQVAVLARNTVDRQPGTAHQPDQYTRVLDDKSTKRTSTEMRADDCCQDS